MSIGQFLSHATKALTDAGIASARLDSLILLEDTVDRNRAWLLAHPEILLTQPQISRLTAQLERRVCREPLAYIRGKVTFYSRVFHVTPAVLIPRPETEQLIEIARSLKPDTVLDVGTGSGAIAITLALELPYAHIEACDISSDALAIASQNGRELNANVDFFASDLLTQSTKKYDLIIANLPYVDRNWQRSPETAYEPELALFADDNGLQLIKKLIRQATKRLTKNGHLLLEADTRQLTALQDYAQKRGFTAVKQDTFSLLLQAN